MSTSRAGRKMLTFGMLGATGCLLACALGEGVLLAALRLGPAERAATPSLVSRPEPPPAAPPTAAPPRPKEPAAPKPPTPPPPPEEFDRRRLREGGKTGDVHIMLKWDNYNDIDLHCVDPSGSHIYFGEKKALSGGWLDVDMNAGGERSSRPIENIYWPTGGAPLGRFKVWVHYYAQHDNVGPTDYEVTIRYGDRREGFKGTLRGRNDRSIEKTFELKPGLQVATAGAIDLAPGGENRLPVVVAREYYRGPVTLTLEGDLQGLQVGPLVLDAGMKRAEFPLRSTTAASGTRNLRVRARTADNGTEAVAAFSLTILQPSLKLAAPPSIDLGAAGENSLPVVIVREHFQGPVTVGLGGDLEGLKTEKLTIPENETRADVPLRANGSRSGLRSLRLEAKADGAGSIQAEAAFDLNVLAPPEGAGWNWLKVPIMGLWTALLACGLSFALVAGQNHYLKRPWWTAKQMMVLVLGGLCAGLLAGGLGEVLQHPALTGRALPATLGFLAGWLLLGGLLGRGVGYFIPNLHGGKAAAAGAIGGLLGAGAFVAASGLGAALAGRILGGLSLGFCIGLMVALVEAAFRKAWLDIEYGPREVGGVNLGVEPISIGADGRSCTILARNAPPIAFRYWFRDGKVLCEDVTTGQVGEAPPNHHRQIGSLGVTVRTAAEIDAGPPGPAARPGPVQPPVVMQPAAKPAPIVQKASPRPAVKPAPGDSCPGCGYKAAGAPGKRYCMICDMNF